MKFKYKNEKGIIKSIEAATFEDAEVLLKNKIKAFDTYQLFNEKTLEFKNISKTHVDIVKSSLNKQSCEVLDLLDREYGIGDWLNSAFYVNNKKKADEFIKNFGLIKNGSNQDECIAAPYYVVIKSGCDDEVEKGLFAMDEDIILKLFKNSIENGEAIDVLDLSCGRIMNIVIEKIRLE